MGPRAGDRRQSLVLPLRRRRQYDLPQGRLRHDRRHQCRGQHPPLRHRRLCPPDRHAGYEYFTIGFALSYEQFDNNQNHFTYGNGGYFSPQYLLQGIVQAQFLTEEGRRWLASGSVGAGVQNNKQDASPYFPLDDNGQEFDSQESTTGIGLIQLQGGYLIDPNWMIGGSLNYNITADYNEGGIYIWGRYFFDRRKGLLRTDLIGFDLFQ